MMLQQFHMLLWTAKSCVIDCLIWHAVNVGFLNKQDILKCKMKTPLVLKKICVLFDKSMM